MLRILVADDHPVVRQGIMRIIEDTPDMRVTGEAGSGIETVRKVKEKEFISTGVERREQIADSTRFAVEGGVCLVNQANRRTEAQIKVQQVVNRQRRSNCTGGGDHLVVRIEQAAFESNIETGNLMIIGDHHRNDTFGVVSPSVFFSEFDIVQREPFPIIERCIVEAD